MLSTSPSLLEALRTRPDEANWQRLVQLYSPLLYRWMLERNLQPADAADLVQNVFRVLVQKLPEFQYDTQGSFRGWLRAIAVNIWRNHCREHAKQPILVAEMEHWDESHDSFSEEQHRKELIEQALVVLQPEFGALSWQAFMQHGILRRPAAQVATELNTTIGSIYAMKCRVLARVREYLRGLLDENS